MRTFSVFLVGLGVIFYASPQLYSVALLVGGHCATYMCFIFILPIFDFLLGTLFWQPIAEFEKDQANLIGKI